MWKSLNTLLLAAFLGMVCSHARAQIGFSLLSAERLWDMARVGAPVVSPDGKWIVFTLTRLPASERDASIDLWLLSTEGKTEPRQLTRNPGPDFDPSWSPDSRSILYSSQRGDDSAQIYLLSLRGGEPQPLTTFPTGATRPRWRSGTDTIIFQAITYPDIGDNFEKLMIRSHRAVENRGISHATEARVIRRGESTLADNAVVHLFELDPGNEHIRDLMHGFDHAVAVSDLDWDLSRDGRLLSFAPNITAPPYQQLSRDVFVLDLNEGQLTNLTADNPGDDYGPRFSPNGNFLVYGRKRTPDSLAEFTQLVRHTFQNGQHTVLTDPSALSPDYWEVGKDSQRVYFQAQQQARRHTFRVGSSGGKPHKIIEGGNTTMLARGPENELYFINESLSQPPAIQTTDHNGLHLRQLTFFNRVHVETTRFGSARDFRFKGAAGDDVHGLMVLPPGFTNERRWPLIVALHGGPHSAWLDAFHFRWNLNLLASPGYVVAAINVHGSTGYGAQFASSVVGNPVEPAARDILAALDHLAGYGYIDTTRAAVIGGSYGGYLGAWMLTTSDRFKAAVLHAGVIDLVSQYASDFPWGREHTYGALPWEDPAQLTQWSPSHRARNIRTPVLLLHGEKDYRVPVSHSLLLHNVLTGQGVPSRIVLFPEEGHTIDGRQSAEIWWQETFDWLHRHLGAQ